MLLLLFGAQSGGDAVGSFVAADASALTTSVTTLTGVTWPAHVADDVAIVAWASDNTQTRTEPPTGFTSEFTNADGSLRAIVASLDSTGSESGDVSLVCGGANRQAGVVALYRGYSAAITNITSQAETSGTGVTSHSSPSITPTDSGSAIVLIYMDRVTSSVAPSAPAGYAVRGSFATGGSGGVTVVVADKLTGLTAGVPESPAAWTAATAGTAAYVIALELVPNGTTGTVAVTQAANTSTASGTLGYTGTAATGQAANTSAASGTVTGPVTGTVAATQAANTASASGTLGYTGSAAVPQAAQASSASGQLGYTGTSARTQAANTSTASGTFTASGTSGTVAVTQANQTAAATGKLGYTGTSSSTQAGQTATASGKLGYSASGAPVQAANTATASGLIINPVTGAAAIIQGDQVAVAAGVLSYTATVSVVQASDMASASGIYFIPVTGAVAAAQASQQAAATGVALGHTVPRPDQGTTARPATIPVARPYAGITERP